MTVILTVVSDMPENDESEFEEFEVAFNYAPVPEVFHSFAEEGPFSKCTICEGALLEDGTQYLIHRAFHRGEVIFEYAICQPCRVKMIQELSAESMERLAEYFSEYQSGARNERMIERHGIDVEPWLSHCLITGKPIADEDEYHFYAWCDGPDLVFCELPFALAGEIDEEVEQLLSKKTRDELDGFMDEQFGLPPELRKPIKGRPVLV